MYISSQKVYQLIMSIDQICAFNYISISSFPRRDTCTCLNLLWISSNSHLYKKINGDLNIHILYEKVEVHGKVYFPNSIQNVKLSMIIHSGLTT